MQPVLMFVLLISALKEIGAQNDDVRRECVGGTWYGWFDRDNPGGHGDYELLSLQPGVPCEKPFAIDYVARPGIAAGLIYHVSYAGVFCVNVEQTQGRRCPDFSVRFCCLNPIPECAPPNAWTPWFDIGNPGGNTGDYELLSDLIAAHPEKVCEKPSAVHAVLLPSMTPWQTGGNTMTVDVINGLICKHDDQPKKECCKDYAIRFCCKLCKKARNYEIPIKKTDLVSQAAATSDLATADLATAVLALADLSPAQEEP